MNKYETAWPHDATTLHYRRYVFSVGFEMADDPLVIIRHFDGSTIEHIQDCFPWIPPTLTSMSSRVWIGLLPSNFARANLDAEWRDIAIAVWHPIEESKIM